MLYNIRNGVVNYKIKGWSCKGKDVVKWKFYVFICLSINKIKREMKIGKNLYLCDKS